MVGKNDALNKHITRTCKKLGLEAVLQSGDSYFAVVFDTPEKRDRSLEALRAKKFRLDSKAVSLQIMPFGVPDEAANTIWTIRGGYGDTTEKISGAIRTQFGSEKEAEAFFGKVTVKKVLQNEVPNGQFMARIDKPAPWIGKQLKMGNDFRLITCEPATRCRFCSQKEHCSWDCEESTSFSLQTPGTVCTVSTPQVRPKQPAPR